MQTGFQQFHESAGSGFRGNRSEVQRWVTNIVDLVFCVRAAEVFDIRRRNMPRMGFASLKCSEEFMIFAMLHGLDELS